MTFTPLTAPVAPGRCPATAPRARNPFPIKGVACTTVALRQERKAMPHDTPRRTWLIRPRAGARARSYMGKCDIVRHASGSSGRTYPGLT